MNSKQWDFNIGIKAYATFERGEGIRDTVTD